MDLHDRPVFRRNGLLACFVPAGVIAWTCYGFVRSEHLGRKPVVHIIAAAIALPRLKVVVFMDSISFQGSQGRISFIMIATSAVSGELRADAGWYPPA
ncbi:MAG: hypothetical protein IT496_12465 [Gammaproteobacteria bacterium]|nr:hypothetical protein [Gammaproteobacteria bacterium]MCG3143819.1 hypothetical protein [Gammaproteobacteria bacterium]